MPGTSPSTSAQQRGNVASCCPGRLVWVSADPAHQVRISCKDPLHAVPDFEDQWQRLLGGGLQKVLRTFSFGKQRFDSTLDPMLKYCCLLHAIAVLCAMQAADDTCLH